jgi:Ca2+:H+ antiporter
VAKSRVNRGDPAAGTTAAKPMPHDPAPRSWLDWVDPRRIGWLRSLLVFVPVTIVLWLAGAPAVWRFAGAALAIIPLAGLLGEATEHLAHRLGPGVGGLLNATFGNAAELIIALFALFRGYDDVVKASLTGSVIGNLLLVLGASLLAGGLKYPVQKFNKTAAGVGGIMMVLAAIGMVVPATFHHLLAAQGPTPADRSDYYVSTPACL